MGLITQPHTSHNQSNWGITLTIGDQIKGGGKWSFQGSNEPPKQAPKKKENEKELCIIIFDRKAGR